MMWRMRGPWREFHQKRLLGGDRLCVAQPINCPVGHIGHEVIALFGAFIRLNRSRILEQHRIILVRFAADEAVEIIETHPGRPTVERTHDTTFPIRRVVIFAEPRGQIAIAFEDATDACRRGRDHVVVTWKARCPFCQEARTAVMMVTPGDQRRAGWPAYRRSVEAVVLETGGGKLIKIWCWHRAAECADLTKAHIVE